jgi:hypothetical protein
MDHNFTVTTEVLDQMVKSLMQSVTANTKRRRRLPPGSRAEREATEEGDLLQQGLTQLQRAQAASWNS